MSQYHLVLAIVPFTRTVLVSYFYASTECLGYYSVSGIGVSIIFTVVIKIDT